MYKGVCSLKQLIQKWSNLKKWVSRGGNENTMLYKDEHLLSDLTKTIHANFTFMYYLIMTINNDMPVMVYKYSI